MTSSDIPAVLTFPGKAQNSLSTFRALKNVRDLLENLAHPRDGIEQCAFDAALDDLELLMGAIK
jgi:hypothetical protein